MIRIITAALAAALACTAASAETPRFPDHGGHRVVDLANEIPAADEATLERELKAFETKSGHQMVVVTVPDLGGMNRVDYAYQLGRAWKLGRAGVDDGIVLLQSPGDGRPGSGETHIAVGYGLEHVVTDADADGIQRYVMLPILKGDPGTDGEGLERAARVAPALLAGARETMRQAAITPEQKAADDRKEAAELARRNQRMLDALAGFALWMAGLAAIALAAFAVWWKATAKRRAARRTEEARQAALRAERAAEEEKRRVEQRERLRRERLEMLAAMTPEAREAFLERERVEAERRLEAERRAAARRRERRAAADRAEAEERRRREREEESRETSRGTWSEGTGSDAMSDDEPDFSGKGGSFGGGGSGMSY